MKDPHIDKRDSKGRCITGHHQTRSHPWSGRNGRNIPKRKIKAKYHCECGWRGNVPATAGGTTSYFVCPKCGEAL